MCNGLIIQKDLNERICQSPTQMVLAVLEENIKIPCIRNMNLEQLNGFITEKMSSKFWEWFPTVKI